MRERIGFTAKDGTKLYGYRWDAKAPKAAVVIVHGMAEHCVRYDRFATALNEVGYSAMALDLRGHGMSAQSGIKGYFAKKDGWKVVLGDIKGFVDFAKEAYPGIPIVMFGHSMGSIFARVYISEHGQDISACILSGVTINKKGLRDVAPFITKLVSVFNPKKPSKMLDSMSFGAFNKPFEPARTKFDWLSRDEAEVDKYVEDEMCGFVCTAPLFGDVSRAILFTLKEENVNKIPKDLKVFIVSGEKDPVGSNGYDAKYLYDSYTKSGLDAEYKIYKDARHELLNETNREEVMADILSFLESAIA